MTLLSTPGSDSADQRASTSLPHPVLEPVQIGSLRLANRSVVAPMSRVSADPDGRATTQMAAYYRSFADGGFGLVITEGIYPDARFGRGYERQPGLVNEHQRDAWRVVTDAVHDAGAPVIAQLMHAGALSQCLDDTIAPSAVPPRGQKLSDYGGSGAFPLPREMSLAQIEAAVGAFATAARTAAAAGFDGVEIHGANGYLLDQFITRYTNRRTDEYGGGPAARIRLTAEVLRAVRASTPAGFVVGVRLSQTKVNDMVYRWSGPDEATTYFAAVAEAGADYVHVASEGRRWHDTAIMSDGRSITALAREVTGLPIVANGGMHDPALAREILDDGHADLVSLASGALANRDWPLRVRDGRTLAAFDKAILHPSASLDNAEAVEAARSDQGSAR